MNEEDDISSCFLCKIKFEVGDPVSEFFGGYAHCSCFDNKMENNARRENIKKWIYQKRLHFGW